MCVFGGVDFFSIIYIQTITLGAKFSFRDLILNFSTILCFSADCTKVTPCPSSMIYISRTTVKLDAFTLFLSFNGKHSNLLLRCTLLLGFCCYISSRPCFSAEYFKVYSCPLFTGTIDDVGPTTVN